MQKRRHKSNTSELPITMPTAIGATTRMNNIKGGGKINRQTNKSTISFFCLFILFIVLLGFILMSEFDYVSHHPMKESDANKYNMTGAVKSWRKTNDGTLSKFPSLKYALENAELVGLYFAASWCPDSLPVSKKIEEIFSVDTSPISGRVLPRQTDFNKLTTKKDFALVYVPSDESEEDMMSYVKHNWIPVPFESPDKSNLKLRFSVCAEREMESLGIIKRTQEIPALVIIDTETHSVLTVNGKNDVMEYGIGALYEWLRLKDLVRALSEKYADDEEHYY